MLDGLAGIRGSRSHDADRIGEFWSYPESHALAELLIDCEENRTLPGRCSSGCGGGPTGSSRCRPGGGGQVAQENPLHQPMSSR